MKKDEIKNLIYERGFDIWATLGNNQYQCMDELGINLYVDWETDTLDLYGGFPKRFLQSVQKSVHRSPIPNILKSYIQNSKM